MWIPAWLIVGVFLLWYVGRALQEGHDWIEVVMALLLFALLGGVGYCVCG